MSSEIEALHKRYNSNLAALEKMKTKEDELSQTLSNLETTHTEAISLMVAEHQAALSQKDSDLGQLTEKHQTIVDALEKDLAASIDSLRLAKEEHAVALKALRADHERLMAAQKRESEEANHTLSAEHSAAIASLKADHASILKQRETESSTTEEEYYDALTKVRQDHAQSLEKQLSEHNQALDNLREEHASELRTRELAQQGMMSESQSSQALTISNLQNEHTAALSRKEAALLKEIEQAKVDHERLISSKEEDFRIAQSKLRAENERIANQLRDESRSDVEKLHAALLTKDTELLTLAERVDACEASLSDSQASYQQMEDKERVAREEILRLLESHKEALALQEGKFEAQIRSLAEERMKEMQTLRDSHEKLNAEAALKLTAIQEQHRVELDSAGQAATNLAVSQERQQLLDSHKDAISLQESKADAQMQSLREEHARELEKIYADHERLKAEAATDLDIIREQHRVELESAGKATTDLAALQERQRDEQDSAIRASEQLLASEKARSAKSLEDLQQTFARERAELQAERDALTKELETHRLTHQETTASHSELSKSHEVALKKRDEELRLFQDKLETALSQQRVDMHAERELLAQELETHRTRAEEASTLLDEERKRHTSIILQRDEEVRSFQNRIDDGNQEKEQLEKTITTLREELDKTRSDQSRLDQEASNRDSLMGELEKHRSIMAELQDNLQKVKDQKDTLQMERNRQDSIVRELQAQVARAASPPVTRNAQRSATSASKLPPPTPPPSIPPPPLPRSMDQTFSSSSQSSAVTSTSSRDSHGESSNTSVGQVSLTGAAPDSKVLESQAKQIEEQEVMIKTLNKQLMHCETDLQTHMDIVSTLETSLGDSEKNRKSHHIYMCLVSL